MKAGDRVYVTGTRYNGFRGEVFHVLRNGFLIQLDEWDHPVKLFTHNLIKL